LEVHVVHAMAGTLTCLNNIATDSWMFYWVTMWTLWWWSVLVVHN